MMLINLQFVTSISIFMNKYLKVCILRVNALNEYSDVNVRPALIQIITVCIVQLDIFCLFEISLCLTFLRLLLMLIFRLLF